MFTYKFYVDAKRNDSLMLRITNNRKKAELAMGLRVAEKELEDAKSLSASPNLRLGKLLVTWTAQIKDYMLELADAKEQDKDVREIKTELQKRLLRKDVEEQPSAPEVKGSFTQYFQRFIDRKTNQGTKDTYQHSLARIRLFDSDIDKKSFEDIGLQWLTEFEAFCAQTANKNARNIHLRNIRAVFNNAIDFDVTTAYPFRRFKIRPEATRKRSLTVEELRMLFDYPVESYAEIYRDMFKLIFMLIGINSVDLWGLQSITKDGRIEYKRAKTHKLYSIKVEPEAMEIITKYKGQNGLLCIADRWTDHRNFRHQCNNALHAIGAEKNKGGRVKGGAPKKNEKGNKAKGAFPELTIYAARHSWATIAADLDVPDAVISQALGHSGANSTTEIYIRRNQKKVDDANRRVLDWVLYGKR